MSSQSKGPFLELTGAGGPWRSVLEETGVLQAGGGDGKHRCRQGCLLEERSKAKLATSFVRAPLHFEFKQGYETLGI